MIPMSGDEVLVLLATSLIGGFVWLTWVWRMTAVHALYRSLSISMVPLGAAVVGAVLTYMILKVLAAHDVRDDGRYVAFYMIFVAAWVGGLLRVFPYMGLSPIEDVAERRNASAAWATAGALLGSTLCIGLANVGDGPGWWCVAFAGFLSTSAWLISWLIVENAAAVSESITVERDLATGLRFGALLIALGLLFGRGAAGDWTSAPQTIIEFSSAWPAIPLLVIATLVERSLSPALKHSTGSVVLRGAFPALAYLGAAAVGLSFVGMPQ
jgi:hypothetical protein